MDISFIFLNRSETDLDHLHGWYKYCFTGLYTNDRANGPNPNQAIVTIMLKY